MDSTRPLLRQPLVEIFWLDIDKKDIVDDLHDLLGKLKIFDGWEAQCVNFDFTDESCYESAKKKPKVDACCADESRNESARGERCVYARLTGPNRAISACGVISIDLEFENDDTVLIPDKDDFNWVSLHMGHRYKFYDEPRFAKISCKRGDITMMYAVIKNAAEAYVEIFLKSVTAPAKIYGKITAQNTIGETLLFEKGVDKDIEVWPDVPIPLSRRVVSVPLHGKLIICADVREYNSDLHSYKSIVQGRAELDPEICLTDKASIKGAFGDIEVKVSWLPICCDISKGVDSLKLRPAELVLMEL